MLDKKVSTTAGVVNSLLRCGISVGLTALFHLLGVNSVAATM
jgi:hypothetical protein